MECLGLPWCGVCVPGILPLNLTALASWLGRGGGGGSMHGVWELFTQAGAPVRPPLVAAAPYRRQLWGPPG
jgi:hypothetical protein